MIRQMSPPCPVYASRNCPDGVVGERQGADLRRQGEDDVIVGNRQKLRLAFFEPLPRRRALTLRAMAVAAGIVGDAFVRMHLPEPLLQIG